MKKNSQYFNLDHNRHKNPISKRRENGNGGDFQSKNTITEPLMFIIKKKTLSQLPQDQSLPLFEQRTLILVTLPLHQQCLL